MSIMRLAPALVLLSLMALQIGAQDSETAPEKKAEKHQMALTTKQEKVGYVLGFDVGRRMKELEIDFKLEAYLAAVKAAYEGLDPALDEEEFEKTMEEFSADMQKKAEAQRQAMLEAQQKEGAENLAKGKAYLEANAKRDGVTVLENGLQYEVLTQGTGPAPKGNDEIKALYTGRFIDGTEFDSSARHGNRPITFTLEGGVIPGWIEAAKRMKKGDKWRLFIPPDLAYGPQGFPNAIPPNSTLIFEMEIVDVVAVP